MAKYIIHTDGGSRGNPGPAAIGVVIEAEDGSFRMEVNRLARVQFALQALVDEDKFNEYTIDKDDQSRLPKMIREETEKDLLLLRWSVDGGNFTDNKETDVKIWQEAHA